MLRDLGFVADDLRVVISWDRKMRAYHAVVAVNMDGRALLMETDDTIRRPREHREYRFVFAINEIGMWDHAAAAGMVLR